MFQTLRKLSLVIIYFVDFFFGKSKITIFTSICVFIITFGSILSGVDNFSKDYLGIILTMISNCINVAYNKFTELFKKKTKVSNLKLLIYSNYLSGPILLMLIFATGENKKLFLYFKEKKYDRDNNNYSLLGFIIINIITCFLVIILNTSFFMSNENNNSMFTILMANTKDIFLCILSYFLLEGNKLSIHIVFGLIISTIGAIMFSSKSIYDNISTTKKKKADKNNKSMVNTSQLQIIEVQKELSFREKMIK
jgi:drug/metabolite transporter (DMT)-like permease